MALQSRALPVLITRPEPQATRFSSALSARYGALVHPVNCPLLSPVFLTPPLPVGPFAALILTSETGAIAAGRMVKGGGLLPRVAFCVGDRTAEVARDLGFEAQSAGGEADALVDRILRHPEAAPLLHLHGLETRGDIVRRLCAKGLQAEGLEVYAQEPRVLPKEVRGLLAQEGAVLAPLFSPRTAMIFAKQLKTLPISAHITCIALSPAVAQEVGESTRDVRIAMQPTQESLMNAMDRLIFQT
jgi:uroporphyrinogen-III synthase